MFILPSRTRPAEGALHSAWGPQTGSTETARAPRDARGASPGRLVKLCGPGVARRGALKGQKAPKWLCVRGAEAPTASARPPGLREAGRTQPAGPGRERVSQEMIPFCKTFNQNK